MQGETLLTFLITNGQSWVRRQRNRYRPVGRPLSNSEKVAFGPFFDAHILESARITRTPFVENPDFYAELRARGIPIPLDFTRTDALTFQDTIVVSDREAPADPPLAPLIFRQLVHIVQYEALGVESFVERFVRGWAENGYHYPAIPIERDAYELEDRFALEPQQGFSIEAEILHRLRCR